MSGYSFEGKLVGVHAPTNEAIQKALAAQKGAPFWECTIEERIGTTVEQCRASFRSHDGAGQPTQLYTDLIAIFGEPCAWDQVRTDDAKTVRLWMNVTPSKFAGRLNNSARSVELVDAPARASLKPVTNGKQPETATA